MSNISNFLWDASSLLGSIIVFVAVAALCLAAVLGLGSAIIGWVKEAWQRHRG